MALLTATTAVSVAAGGNYAAADIVSNDANAGLGLPWVFTNMSLGDGKPCTLYSASVTCSEDSVLWRLRLHLFNRRPSAATEMDDNAAKTMDTDDMAWYLGYIDFPAAADLGEISFAQATWLNFGYCLPPDKKELYGIVETLDAETAETALMIITITLHASTE